jgi:hypothetical protein
LNTEAAGMVLLEFVTTFGHGPLLTAHALLGTAVLLAGIAAVFLRPARRVTLYLLGAQILLGAAVSGMLKIAPPPVHAIAAVLVGGVYAAANAMERRGRPPALVRGILILGAVLIAFTYYVGEHALGG